MSLKLCLYIETNTILNLRNNGRGIHGVFFKNPLILTWRFNWTKQVLIIIMIGWR